MPTTTQEQESPEPPPPTPGGTTLESECFPPGQRPRKQPKNGEPARTRRTTEAELLGFMADERSEPEAARDAWAELHERHARYIFTVVARAYGAELGSEESIADVVADTFQSAFDWAGRQPSAEELVARFDDQDPDAVRRRVLGWLSVVARRIAAHRVGSSDSTPAQLGGDVPAPEPGEEPPPTLRNLLHEALRKLSPSEVEALRVSLPWYEPETGEFAFPRGEAAKVAASLGITPDTLRQRRHRTVKRLRSLLATHGAADDEVIS